MPGPNGSQTVAAGESSQAGDVKPPTPHLRAHAEGLVRALHGYRVLIVSAVHLLIFALVYWLAFQLRFDFEVPSDTATLLRISLPWILAVKFAVFLGAGQFHGWWRYVTFADLVVMIRATLIALVLIIAIDYFVVTSYQIPRTVLVFDAILGLMFLGTMRASWRLFREQFRPMLDKGPVRGAVMVGVDDHSAILAYQIQSYYRLPYRVRGFLATEEERARRGARLGQIPILGTVDELPQIAKDSRATDVLVMAGVLSGTRLRKLMELCRQGGLTLKVIRSVEHRLDGDSRIPLRDIEISDLLRRDPVQLDMQSIGQLLAGRRVMVTGAGGSIGSEICRQVLKFNPRSLILVGRGENRIFAIERELRGKTTSTDLIQCIADVTDIERMRAIFERHHPEVVFHAAAHKHVPLMEANIGEAIKNNVLGTKNVADLADQFGVDSFVFISTDKVVNPSSIMGVSKHLAERYIHALSQESSTRFAAVRFGNVLGSTGSVVPIFQEQIRNGGPITVTDPRMARFFMTIPEASQLVLQAAAMGRGGEIFVLEMGEPVRIVDLARDLIRLSGLPEHSIEINFTGIRPGEKLFEELYFDDEQTLPTAHAKVRAAYHRPFSIEEVRTVMQHLEELVHAPESELRRRLRELVPEYVPSQETAESLVRVETDSRGLNPAL